MNMKNLLNRALALICVVLMMVSLFALPAFAEDSHEGHDHATSTVEWVKVIPWIVLGGVVVVGVAVLLIKCPEKISKALRVYKSEFKKVSWLSWKETKKNSVIVLGMLAACALVICLLDLGLYEGLVALIQTLKDLF